MKLTTTFLTVLAATASLAAPTKDNCESIINEKYSVCASFMLGSNFGSGFNENYCIEYESENCQKLYTTSTKDIYAEIPECKGLSFEEEMLKQSDYLIKFIYNSLKIACAKDEQGNYCPYSYANIQNYDSLEDIEYEGPEKTTYMKYLNESCRSKKCIDEYLSYIDNIKEVSSNIEFEELKLRNEKELDKYYSLFKSETCTAQIGKVNVNTNDKVDTSIVTTSNVNATNVNNDSKVGSSNDKTNSLNGNGKTDVKSGATQITYSNVLFVGLTILLSTLF